jgi:predicted site-specific integrase-resolvase
VRACAHKDDHALFGAVVEPARLYGSRSRKNQKLLDSVKKAVEEMQA